MKPTRIGLNSLCLLCLSIALQFVIQPTAIAGNKGNPVVNEVAGEADVMEKVANCGVAVEQPVNDSPLETLANRFEAPQYFTLYASSEHVITDGFMIRFDENDKELKEEHVYSPGQELHSGFYIAVTDIYLVGSDTDQPNIPKGAVVELVVVASRDVGTIRDPGFSGGWGHTTTPTAPGGCSCGEGYYSCCNGGTIKCACYANGTTHACTSGGPGSTACNPP